VSDDGAVSDGAEDEDDDDEKKINGKDEIPTEKKENGSLTCK
jgi:hypothetical protein